MPPQKDDRQANCRESQGAGELHKAKAIAKLDDRAAEKSDPREKSEVDDSVKIMAEAKRECARYEGHGGECSEYRKGLQIRHALKVFGRG
jgi:hypothetical protein